MTEGDRVHYRLQLRKHRELAKSAGSSAIPSLHSQWIDFYELKLDGNHRAAVPALSLEMFGEKPSTQGIRLAA